MSKIDVAASVPHTVASYPADAFPTFVTKSHASFRACFLAACAILLLPFHSFAQTSAYVQTNLISDGAVPAKQTDPTLINPWGVSIGQDWWIDSPGSGFSLVEDNNFNKSFAV